MATPEENASFAQTCQLTSNHDSEPNGASFTEAIQEEIGRERRLGEELINSESISPVSNENLNSSALCKFNGYSNLEISVFFALALFTSVLFLMDMSEYIYQVIWRNITPYLLERDSYWSLFFNRTH